MKTAEKELTTKTLKVMKKTALSLEKKSYQKPEKK